MAIARRHNWPHYAGNIAAWRMQAANDYQANVYALNHGVNWKAPVNEVISGVNVTFNIGNTNNDEDNPNDKKRGVRRAIERITAARPALVFPNLHVYITKKTNGPTADGGNRQIPTVGMHVDAAGNNHATIILSGSSVQPNPLQGPPNPLKSRVLRCRNTNFHASMGQRGPRGIADYWYETMHARKLSNRIAAITIHELGHILHQTLQPARFWPLNCAAGDFGMNPDRKLDISLYANASLCEFVAEVFTARILGCGIAMPATIIADYNTLGGPW